MADALRACKYCAQTHGTMLLCDPARRILDALLERGMDLNMPTIEFPEPVAGVTGMFGGATVLVSQVVAKAALLPFAGVIRPAIILTGRDAEGQPLPEWIYPAEDAAALREVTRLVSEHVEIAIRRAAAGG